jgi:hypothetical protein
MKWINIPYVQNYEFNVLKNYEIFAYVCVEKLRNMQYNMQ